MLIGANAMLMKPAAGGGAPPPPPAFDPASLFGVSDIGGYFDFTNADGLWNNNIKGLPPVFGEGIGIVEDLRHAPVPRAVPTVWETAHHATITQNGNVLTFANTPTGGEVRTNGYFTINRVSRMRLTIAGTGSVNVYSGHTSPVLLSAGSHEYRNFNNANYLIIRASGTFNGTVTLEEITERDGLHLNRSTASQRPIYYPWLPASVPELAPNPNFDSNATWSSAGSDKPDNVTWSNGQWTISERDCWIRAEIPGTLAGRQYRVDITITANNAGGTGLRVGQGSSASNLLYGSRSQWYASYVGVFSHVLTAGQDNFWLTLELATNNASITLDAVSVREITAEMRPCLYLCDNRTMALTATALLRRTLAAAVQPDTVRSSAVGYLFSSAGSTAHYLRLSNTAASTDSWNHDALSVNMPGGDAVSGLPATVIASLDGATNYLEVTGHAAVTAANTLPGGTRNFDLIGGRAVAANNFAGYIFATFSRSEATTGTDLDALRTWLDSKRPASA